MRRDYRGCSRRMILLRNPSYSSPEWERLLLPVEACIDPQLELGEPNTAKRRMKSFTIISMEPVSSAVSAPGPECLPPGRERPLTPEFPPGTPPEVDQLSLPPSPLGLIILSPGGEICLWDEYRGRAAFAANFTSGSGNFVAGVRHFFWCKAGRDFKCQKRGFGRCIKTKTESEKPMGDESDGDKGHDTPKLQNSIVSIPHPSARRGIKSGGCRGGNRHSRTGADAKKKCVYSDLLRRQETHDATDNGTDSAVTE